MAITEPVNYSGWYTLEQAFEIERQRLKEPTGTNYSWRDKYGSRISIGITGGQLKTK